jgi:hypothetical protein
MKQSIVRTESPFAWLNGSKGILIRTFVLFFLFSTVNSFNAPKAEAQFSISFQAFYDDLSPYGDWVYNHDHGYVWVPNQGRNFVPYATNGHWVYTRQGWTWVSRYSWGWAPFHYGRWFRDGYYGWVWVPDTEWGPGWVNWRRGDGYYGWTPIGPGFSFEFGYNNDYDVPYDNWRFVRDRDFGRNDIDNYYISTNNYTTIINNTTVINNIQTDNDRKVRYNAGPDRAEVEQRTRRTYTPVTIRESNKPEENLRGN